MGDVTKTFYEKAYQHNEYAGPEHVTKIEQALNEIIILRPAWYCEKWLSEGIKVRKYSDLKLMHRLWKFVLPIVDNKIIFKCRIAMRRFNGYFYYNIFHGKKLKYIKLKANYDYAWEPDSDACNNLDQYSMILWMKQNGCKYLGPKFTIKTMKDILIFKREISEN